MRDNAVLVGWANHVFGFLLRRFAGVGRRIGVLEQAKHFQIVAAVAIHGNLVRVDSKPVSKPQHRLSFVDAVRGQLGVAKAAGPDAVGIILTGMGGDGAKGLLSMRKAGARTIGQDESTCVVYGMPKVAYDLGAVEYQEKLSDIAGRTYALLNKM